MKLGRTLAELRRTMSVKEFHEWQWFYSQHPFDDDHLYYRPAAMISQSIAGGTIKEKMEWLHPKPPERIGNLDGASLNTIRAFGIPLSAFGIPEEK